MKTTSRWLTLIATKRKETDKMAGDWIKFEKATLDKPEVFEMAGILGIDPDAVVGKLLRVWDWFDDQSLDGCAPVALAAQLNRNTGCAQFTEAMQQVGWLVIEDARLQIPNFIRHNGQTAKDRALSGKRMAKSRAKSCGGCVTSNVTKPQPEKRREEKSNNPPNPQGGNGPELFKEPEIEQKERCLPKDWRKITKADQKKTRVLKNSQAMIQIGEWFGRKQETLWTVAEAASLIMILPAQGEIDGMGIYYSAQIPADDDIRRRDLGTLLNNWSGELDRARKFVNSQTA